MLEFFCLSLFAGGPDPFLGNTAVIPKKRSGGSKSHQTQQYHQDDPDHPALKQDHSYSEKYMPSVGVHRNRDEGEREQRMGRKSLSNSWPDPGIGMDEAPSSISGRKKLDLNLGMSQTSNLLSSHFQTYI